MEQLSPAEYVIAQFGGYGSTAKALQAQGVQISRSGVCRWVRQDRTRKPRDGYIPPAYHRPILAAAQARRLPIDPLNLIYGGYVESES